jgi:hypothetical protein
MELLTISFMRAYRGTGIVNRKQRTNEPSMRCSFKPDIFGFSRFDQPRLADIDQAQAGKACYPKSRTRFDFILTGSNHVLIK